MALIAEAAAEVDRPIFYAVAVIVAGFLPIYVLTGPSGRLFTPMADTMIFALVGSLIVTLTVLPVLCSWAFRKGVRERRNAAFEVVKSVYTKGSTCAWRIRGEPRWLGAVARRLAAAGPGVGGEFMPHLDEGALWVRATMPYTISFEESREDRAARSGRSCAPFPRSRRRLGAWAARRRHGSHRLLQRRVLSSG